MSVQTVNGNTQPVDIRVGSRPAGDSTACVIQTESLSKRFGEQTPAVDQLNLRVRRGEVYGFVGPNGAGKTTTLRMLAGLCRPSSGTALVLGHPAGSAQSMAGVGAVIEAPGFYPYLSGRDNLRVMAGHAGVAASRVEAVLAQVELSQRAGDRFSAYSLGMKQRLGLAAALLKEPQMLILDEPTNGLDPQGIADMRALIRTLGSGECTVLLSSHLMAEVEQVCDRIGVIVRGRLAAEGTVDELLGLPEIRVRATPLDRARELANRLPGVRAVRPADGALLLTAPPASAAAINRALVSAGVDVAELTPVRASLEETFLRIVRHGETP
jgi:ABC-type multidrug transport system ATPase subunit